MVWWKLAVSNGRKFQRLYKQERWLLVQTLVLLPLTALLLQWLGFRHLYAAMERSSPKKVTLVKSQMSVSAIARLVEIASRYGFYRPNCLQRSLVLWWLLRCRGMESQLRIGVRKQDGLLEAHAWVECGGMVLNDREDVGQQFAPFAEAILPMEVKAA